MVWNSSITERTAAERLEGSGSVVEGSGSVVEGSGSVVEGSGSVVEVSGSVVEVSGSVVDSKRPEGTEEDPRKDVGEPQEYPTIVISGTWRNRKSTARIILNDFQQATNVSVMLSDPRIWFEEQQ